MSKGMSQTIGIVVAIIVGLAAALILIAFLTGTAGKARAGTDEPIENGGNIVKIETCTALCKSCCRLHGDSCPGWGDDTGEGCTDPGVNVECDCND